MMTTVIVAAAVPAAEAMMLVVSVAVPSGVIAHVGRHRGFLEFAERVNEIERLCTGRRRRGVG